MKTIVKILKGVLLFLLLAMVSLVFLLQTESAQTLIARQLADWLSEHMGCVVMIDRVGVKWEGSFFIENLYLSDQHDDTLLFIHSANIRGIKPIKEHQPMAIESAEINGFVFNFSYPENDTTSNLDFLIDFFQSDSDHSDTASLALLVADIQLLNGRFRYDDFSYPEITEHGIDWSHLDVSEIMLRVRDLSFSNDAIESMNFDLTCNEKSGFTLSKFNCVPRFENQRILLNSATIQSNQTEVIGDLGFEFSSYEDFYDFNNKVTMDHTIERSNILLSDLSFFSRVLKGWNRSVQIKTRAIGVLNHLQLQNTELKTGQETNILADMSLQNLDTPDSTTYRIYFNRLNTSMDDLSRIELPPYDSIFQSKLDIPESISAFGKMCWVGKFEGNYESFKMYGELKSDIGTISADVQLDASGELENYRGDITAIDADLGKFYGTDVLGKVSCALNLIGSGFSLEKLAMEIDLDISSIDLNHYTLHDIEAIGKYQHRNFDGEMKIADDNADLTFDGLINFQDSLPVLDFSASINTLNPYVFGVMSDSALSSFSGNIKMRSVGLDYRVFTGFIEMQNLQYCSHNREFNIEGLKLVSRRDGIPVFDLKSDIADGRITGNFIIDEIPASLMDIASHVVPSFHPSIRVHKSQEFDLQFTLRNSEPLTSIFAPQLHIAEGTFIQAAVQESESKFECTLSSSFIAYTDYSINDLVMDIHRPDENVYVTLNSEALVVGKDLRIDGAGLDVRVEKDTLHTSLTWQQQDKSHSGDLNGRLILMNNGILKFDFDESKLSVLDLPFDLNEHGLFIWSDSKLQVVDFSMVHENQKLTMNGVASSMYDDSLNVSLKNLDLKFLQNRLSKGDSIRGLVDVDICVYQVLSSPFFSSKIRCLGLSYNQTSIGDIYFDALWDDNNKALRLDGNLSAGIASGNVSKFIPLSFNGYYYPNQKDQQLDLTANIKAFKLQTLNAFLPDESILLQGTARGTLAVSGRIDAPKIQSRLFLERSSIYIDYLNTKYFFSSYLNILPDMITLDNIAITDEEGHQGQLTGQLLHSNFRNWNFDLMLDFNQPMLMLNTVEQADVPFFGKAYGSGYLGISGDANSLSYEAQLKTEKGTYLGFPMGSSSEDDYDSFIAFKPKTDSVISEVKSDLSGLKLNLGIDVTSDAKFEVIFDKSVGDVMSGVGKGHLDLGVDQFSNLSMSGGLDLLEGNYKFTLKNLINKDFVITPGGRIDWTGDPMAGNLAITAVYKVPASLFDLLNDPQYQGGQRVPVNLGLSLKGAMLNPLIDFDIELPTVDQMTRSRVGAVLNSDQERNRQAFALLMLRRFVSPPSVSADHSSTSALSANGTELLSSQISNWLGQISNDFNLGFNYNPGDDISNEEIALALSTQFFNDRLILSSNLGVSRNNTNNTNQNTSNLIGDVRVEYKITPSGKVRLVMYNESNDYRMASTQQSPYTQGLGVIYREDFDNMQQLIEGLRKMLKGRPKSEGNS